MKISQEHDILI